LQKKFHCELGVLIIDSHGRAWRNGTVGTAIGVAGMPALVDLVEMKTCLVLNLRSPRLQQQMNLRRGLIADGSGERRYTGGFGSWISVPSSRGSLRELIRPEELDLFR
jgi:coenzyme F420-0:L-glutamate ligase/coenzyme F420-1:gamma-L-glutamate ligase